MNTKAPGSAPRLPWDNPRFRNWIAVVRAERAVVRELAKAIAPLDLKIGQLDVLMNLYRHPGVSQHDLARRLLVGRSNITMLLPQLEKNGLLKREADEKDRRVLRLSLTDEGEKRLMAALAIYTELLDRVMAGATTEQCERLGDEMRKISNALDDT